MNWQLNARVTPNDQMIEDSTETSLYQSAAVNIRIYLKKMYRFT